MPSSLYLNNDSEELSSVLTIVFLSWSFLLFFPTSELKVAKKKWLALHIKKVTFLLPEYTEASWMTLGTGACRLYNSSSPLPSPVPVCVTTSSGGPHPSPWRYALLALSREKPGVRIITLQLWRSSLRPQQCWVRCFGTLISFQNTFYRRHFSVWKDPSSEYYQTLPDATCKIVPTRYSRWEVLSVP